MVLEIRRVRPGEGPRLQRARLAALREAPGAFARTFEEEAELDDAEWERRAEERADGDAGCTFFALLGGEVVGLVGGHRIDEDTVELVSMWVAPSARGRRIGRALIDEVIGWSDGSTVELWVTHGNGQASALYRRAGFVPTDDVKPLPSDPCRDEQRMRLTP